MSKKAEVLQLLRALVEPGTTVSELAAAKSALSKRGEERLNELDGIADSIPLLAQERLVVLLEAVAWHGTRIAPGLVAGRVPRFVAEVRKRFAALALKAFRQDSRESMAACAAVLARIGSLGMGPQMASRSIIHFCIAYASELLRCEDEGRSPHHRRSDCYLALADYCQGAQEVTDEVADAIRRLRECDRIDQPILDVLVAWLHPTKEGMRDLACWANGYLQVASPEYVSWIEKIDEQGARAVGSAELLEQVWGIHYAEGVRLAAQLKPAEALRAIEEAIADAGAAREPVVVALLEDWLPRAREASRTPSEWARRRTLRCELRDLVSCVHDEPSWNRAARRLAESATSAQPEFVLGLVSKLLPAPDGRDPGALDSLTQAIRACMSAFIEGYVRESGASVADVDALVAHYPALREVVDEIRAKPVH